MKKNWKRLIAVFCVLAMACSVIPKFEPMQVEAETEATTVTYDTITEGTITGGVAPTETKEDYVFGGWYKTVSGEEGAYVFSDPLEEGKEYAATTDAPVYAKWVPEEVLSVKAQYRQEEEEDEQTTSVQFFDCDTATADGTIFTQISEGITNEVTLVTTDGDYKQGIGALKSVGTDVNRFVFKRDAEHTVDATACSGGALSFWLYVDKPEELASDLKIGLGSGTQNEVDCYQWTYSQASLSVGWNKILLDFRTISKEAGTVDMSSLRLFQIWRASNATVTMIVDDICIVKTEGMLFNCDNKYNVTNDYVTASETYGGVLNSSSVITTTEGEYKEGSGAYKVTGTGTDELWFEITKVTSVDISAYITGSLHFWLYISEPSNLADVLTVQLGTSSTSKYYRFDIAPGNLISGWNEIDLEFSNKKSVTDGLDTTAINQLRIYRKLNDQTKTMTMILDDVRLVKRSEGMLLDCNDTTGVTLNSGAELTYANTTELKEYQEGTGAYKLADKNSQVRHEVKLTTKLNVADDSDNYKCKYNSLRFWLYISDVNMVGGSGLRVEVSSNTETNSEIVPNHDNCEIQWPIEEQYLVKGWNEIYLNLDRAQNTDEYKIDFSEICYLRIYTGVTPSGAFTTILDDVEFVSANDTSAELRFVSTVDSENYQRVGFKIGFNDVNGTSKGTQVVTTSTVYSKLIGISKTEGILTYAPTYFHNDSEAFYAAIFNRPFPSQVFDSVLTVTPFWVTPDGTEVTGVKRLLTVNYIINGSMNLNNQ